MTIGCVAALLLGLVTLDAQPTPRIGALVDAVRPALPFPAASADGDFPADNSPASKWFVAWPASPDDTRIVIKANPLHPETQKAAAMAMGRIQEAVIAAERKAQAAYERALEELRRSGTGSNVAGITLDDEGIAGERIDAELELVIELQPPQTFVLRSGVEPIVAQGTNGPTWLVTVPANTYRAKRGDDLREHFRAAETTLYFGPVARPEVSRKADGISFTVSVPPSAQGFAVIVRGNEGLLKDVVTTAQWAALAR